MTAMKMFNLFSKGEQMKRIAAQRLYETLSGDTYAQYPYQKQDLNDSMYVIKQVIGEYWKPRYLVDGKNKTAVEFMDSRTILQTVCSDDIDWKSLERLPQDVIDKVVKLDAVFPTFVGEYKNGVAEVSWQINPDGRYYMDEDGYGMTNDEEVEIYGYINRDGKVVGKFKLPCEKNKNVDYRKLAEEVDLLNKK